MTKYIGETRGGKSRILDGLLSRGRVNLAGYWWCESCRDVTPQYDAPSSTPVGTCQQCGGPADLVTGDGSPSSVR